MSNGDATAPSPGRRSVVRNVARVVTTPCFLISHLARIRAVDRRVDHVAKFSLAPPRPSLVDDGGVQSALDGEGPMVMRSYSVRISDPELTPAQVMEQFQARPNDFTARTVAAFMVDDRPATNLRAGARVVVELAGPWNGPLLVERADEDELVLATLDGHMEAGRIRFDTAPVGTDDTPSFVFRITSWARAGDRAFEFLHLRLPIGRELQTAMWVATCRRVIAASGGRAESIRVRTEILDRSAER